MEFLNIKLSRRVNNMTIQELEEQVKVLQEEIEKMKAAEKQQKSSRWKPKEGER